MKNKTAAVILSGLLILGQFGMPVTALAAPSADESSSQPEESGDADSSEEDDDDDDDLPVGVDADSDADTTAESYTEIHLSTEEDFRNFAGSCETDSWSRDKKIILDRDIEFTDSFEPAPSFGGIFEGNGHTLKGVIIEGKISNTGVFGTIQKTGVVQNLHVEAIITPEDTQTVIGGITGYNRGLIENCTFDGTAEAGSNVGGIAGYNEEYGRIISCTSSGTIEADTAAGGITGYNDGTIQSCTNNAEVNINYTDSSLSTDDLKNRIDSLILSRKADSVQNISIRTDSGGIAGYSSGLIASCTNNGAVGYEHVGYNMGGIAGRSEGFIRSCTNTALIKGRKDVGGIAGQLEPYLEMNFSEEDLDKIENQLDSINGLLDETLSDTRGYTADTQLQLQQLNDLTGNAEDSIKVITDKSEDYLDRTADRVNAAEDELSAQMHSLSSIVDDYDNYINDVDDAIDDVSDEVENAIDNANLSDEEKQQLQQLLDSLSASAGDLSDALQQLNELKQAIDQISQITDETAREQAKAQLLQSIADQISDTKDSTLEDVMAALEVVKAHGDLSDLEDALDDLTDTLGDYPEDADQIESIIDNIADIDLHIDKVDPEVRNSGNDLYNYMQEMEERLDTLSDSVSGDVNGAVDDLQSLTNAFDSLKSIISDAVDNAQDRVDESLDDKVEDISDEDVEGTTEGRVTASENSGDIRGDMNTGGIVGTIGVELSLNPESDVEQNGSISFDYMLKTKGIVDNCKNKGDVCTQTRYTGGIAGCLEIGLIMECQNYGRVHSDGDYCGGIAGYSRGEEKQNYAKCDVAGELYIGGIDGYGEELLNNVSMVTISDSEQYDGAIAGKVKKVNSDISGNIFYSDTLRGIDSISYEGTAEKVDYETLMQTQGLPDAFRKMTILFLSTSDLDKDADDQKSVDDIILGRIECDYGSSLGQQDLPEIPERDGFHTNWNTSDFSDITQDMTVRAVYTRTTTLLAGSSILRDKDIPAVYVTGRFLSGAELVDSLTSADAAAAQVQDESSDAADTAGAESGDTEEQTLTGWEKIPEEETENAQEETSAEESEAAPEGISAATSVTEADSQSSAEVTEAPEAAASQGAEAEAVEASEAAASSDAAAEETSVKKKVMGETDEVIHLLIPDDGEEEHTVRYLPADTDRNYKIWLIESNGTKQELETEKIGNMIAFTVPGNEITFEAREFSLEDNMVLRVILIVAAVIILLGILAHIRTKIERRNHRRRNAARRAARNDRE